MIIIIYLKNVNNLTCMLIMCLLVSVQHAVPELILIYAHAVTTCLCCESELRLLNQIR